MLKDKKIILAVGGSIAAYKAANIASMLVKKGADVTVLMTENATNFINPMVFETLTGNKCIYDTFDRNFFYSVEHVSLAKSADAFVIAPATANIIAKAANGIADDMVSTTLLACNCEKIIAPAMNTNMYLNPITQDNIEKLKQYGFDIITPGSGLLACKDIGLGRLPKEEEIVEHIISKIAFKRDMQGVEVLVTAGPTYESLDPVRFISNHSTGKMGYSLAKICAYRGAEVTLVSGPSNEEVPLFVKCLKVESAKEMYEAIKEEYKGKDIIIKAAAVADYTPMDYSIEKIKKNDDIKEIKLKRTVDILEYLGDHKKEGTYLCGFSMETENLIENSKKKLYDKNADMIIANNVKQYGAGFGSGTNIVTIITKDGELQLPKLSKDEAAIGIVDEILRQRLFS